MLVDDKLAKEKLIKVLEDLRPRPIVLMGKTEAYANGIRESIKLIRNTDLTDCQPQECELCGGTGWCHGAQEWTPERMNQGTPYKSVRCDCTKAKAMNDYLIPTSSQVGANTTDSGTQIEDLASQVLEVADYLNDACNNQGEIMGSRCVDPLMSVHGALLAMNEHSSGTRAEVPPSATDSGTPTDSIKFIAAKAVSAFNWGKATLPEAIEAALMELASVGGTQDKAGNKMNEMEYLAATNLARLEIAAQAMSWTTFFMNDSQSEARDTIIRGIHRLIAATMARVAGVPPPPEIGTDSALSAKEINPDGADQGSVRNATDRLTDEELIAAWQSAQPTSPLESNDLLRVYVHYMRAVADAQLKKAIRALPVLEDVVTELIKERDDWT